MSFFNLTSEKKLLNADPIADPTEAIFDAICVPKFENTLVTEFTDIGCPPMKFFTLLVTPVNTPPFLKSSPVSRSCICLPNNTSAPTLPNSPPV